MKAERTEIALAFLKQIEKSILAKGYGRETLDPGNPALKVGRQSVVEGAQRQGYRYHVPCFGQKDAFRESSGNTDMGFFGDVVGKCPLCSAEVRRTKYGYGCSAYKEGCKFRVSAYICGRSISKRNVSLMLESGRTSIIRGFVSKRTGKSFDAALRLEGEGCVFDFSTNNQ